VTESVRETLQYRSVAVTDCDIATFCVVSCILLTAFCQSKITRTYIQHNRSQRTKRQVIEERRLKRAGFHRHGNEWSDGQAVAVYDTYM